MSSHRLDTREAPIQTLFQIAIRVIIDKVKGPSLLYETHARGMHAKKNRRRIATVEENEREWDNILQSYCCYSECGGCRPSTGLWTHKTA